MLEDAMIALHLGVPHTGSDLLIQSLISERDARHDNGLHIPDLNSYRDPLINMSRRFRGAPITYEQRQEAYGLICDLLHPEKIERVVLSCKYFLSFPPQIFNDGRLYDRSGTRSKWLRTLFPENPCEFFISIRNPVTFIPQLLRARPQLDYQTLLGVAALEYLNWYDVIERIESTNPDCPVTVWCYEDAATVWGQALVALGGLSEDAPLHRDLDFVKEIVTDEGREWLMAQADDQPAGGHADLITQALEQYVDPAKAETEIDLPGWTAELVETLDAHYEIDIERIRGLTGVTVLSS